MINAVFIFKNCQVAFFLIRKICSDVCPDFIKGANDNMEVFFQIIRPFDDGVVSTAAAIDNFDFNFVEFLLGGRIV